MPALAAGPLALSTIAPRHLQLLLAVRRKIAQRETETVDLLLVCCTRARALLVGKSADGYAESLSSTVAPHLHLDFLARLGTRHDQRKVRRALDRLAVVLDDHITGYNARALGRSALLHRCHQCTFWPAHPEGRCQLLSHLLDLHADSAAAHLAAVLELVRHVHGDID